VISTLISKYGTSHWTLVAT